ncbi:hypothetical protein [Ammoniphilus sp. YIM 78166]|uniref:hypothetical protein n=1 Tax=Ammoniphilus sp. YIM 78166 TaxID=1644106 RepID=UPI00106F633E|nr:hypothetical protein [Ammoniphilus sp. YIM 78166]
MYQPQELVQTWVNGWIYGVKKTFEVQDQVAKQTEQMITLQQEWLKQGFEQQQSLLQQWNEKWTGKTNLEWASWGTPDSVWMQKGWQEQEKALQQSWNQFEAMIKKAKEQQDKGKEQVVSIVEETGEKIKQWAQYAAPIK